MMKYVIIFLGFLIEAIICLLTVILIYSIFAHDATAIDAYLYGWTTAFTFLTLRKIILQHPK